MLSPEAKQKIRAHIAAMPESLRRDPATEQEIREFEESYGPIPEDYRWFLLTCGGGHFGSEEVDDITDLAKSHAKFRREFGPPRGWTMRDVFIIGWDGFANPFGIERTTGRVVVEDHNFGGIHELAPSLEEFMLRGVWRWRYSRANQAASVDAPIASPFHIEHDWRRATAQHRST